MGYNVCMIRSNAEVRDLLRAGALPQEDGCLYFRPGARKEGYALFYCNGKQLRAHQWAWIVEHGAVPAGLVLDHTCHDPKKCPGGETCPHRQCINPEHLQPVTRGVNGSSERQASRSGKKTHCKYGHEFTSENTRINAKGVRLCLSCRRRWNAEQNSKPEVRERQNAWRRANRNRA